MGRKSIDETGKTYGRLKVIKNLGVEPYVGTKFLCQCECGKQCVRTGFNLRKLGDRNSCGCGRKLPRKPKAHACVVCGNTEVVARDMCKHCYAEWYKEKKRIEMEDML